MRFVRCIGRSLTYLLFKDPITRRIGAVTFRVKRAILSILTLILICLNHGFSSLDILVISDIYA